MTKIILSSILIMSIGIAANAEPIRKFMVSIDSQAIDFPSPAILKNSEWLVPLDPICEKLGLTVKTEQDILVVCGSGDSELCVPLQLHTDVFHIDGKNYTYLENITQPFGYQIYKYSKDKVEIVRPELLAPSFTLPDLNDKPINLQDFQGKKTLLYIWGSW